MPAKQRSATKVEVILTTCEHKKHSVRYIDPVGEDAAITNIYLKTPGFSKLGSPAQVKVTIEAYHA